MRTLMLLLALGPLGVAAPGVALPGPGAAAQDAAPTADPVELAAEWPALEDGAAARRQVARLRKARTDEMASDAVARLGELGAAVAPLLLDALGKERDAEARERLAATLTQITGPAHARLLAARWRDEESAVRAFTLERVAFLQEGRLVDEARALYVELLDRADDPDVRPADRPTDEELDRAALTALSTGALEGLDRCLALAGEDWRGQRDALRRAGAGAKGEPATRLLVERLAAAPDDGARVAALHLLAVAGTRESVSTVRRQLDSEANAVRVAAINALRGIVDGDPPLDNLSVFTAIEEARKWKDRT